MREMAREKARGPGARGPRPPGCSLARDVNVTSCGTTVPSEVSYRTDVTASVTETNANTD